MPANKMKDTEKENLEKELHTEGPLDERDEVKKAEERTRKMQKDAPDTSQSTKNTDK